MRNGSNGIRVTVTCNSVHKFLLKIRSLKYSKKWSIPSFSKKWYCKVIPQHLENFIKAEQNSLVKILNSLKITDTSFR